MPAPTKRRPQGRPDLAERRAKVVTMRNAQATYEKIAESLGVSVACVKADYIKAIRETVRIPAEQMVERQEAIFRDVLRVEYPALLDPSSPRHYPAIDRILEVCRDQRKLFGLDAPTRVNLGISEAEFARQAAELLKVTGLGPLRELARSAGPDVVDAEIEDGEKWSNL